MSNTYGVRPATALFSPVQRSGLLFWYRSDLGITLNGSGVSAWADQSGNGRDLTQATAAKQPIYSASDASYSGAPSLNFVSANVNTMSTAAFGSPIAQPGTVYIVTTFTGPASTEQHIFDAISFGHRWSFYRNASANDWVQTDGLGGGNDGGASGAKSVFGLLYNTASSSVYRNDSVNALSSGALGGDTLAGITVGSLLSGGVNAYDGSVTEILGIAGVDSQAQRTQMFSYLGARYGVAVT